MTGRKELAREALERFQTAEEEHEFGEWYAAACYVPDLARALLKAEAERERLLAYLERIKDEGDGWEQRLARIALTTNEWPGKLTGWD